MRFFQLTACGPPHPNPLPRPRGEGTRKRRNEAGRFLRWSAIVLLMLGLAAKAALARAGTDGKGTSGILSDTPLNARYEIAGEAISLVGGRFEKPAAPGSAATVRSQILGHPVFGDIDGDGDVDAVVWLVQQPGGSGTFYYLAAAFNQDGGFRGTRAVFVGDRIAPRHLIIAHGVVTASIAVRRDDEPMAAPPTVERVSYFTSTPDGLVAVAERVEEDALVHGLLIIGHEVRSFLPCGEAHARWLTGAPETIQALVQTYRTDLPNAPAYAPLFASVLGHRAEAPTTGFGTDYAGAFAVRKLVRTWPAGRCVR